MMPAAPAIRLQEMITEKHIVFLKETTRIDAIRRLVDHAWRLSLVTDKKHFEAALMERERIVTTGIGLGAAVPHARLAGITDFFILLGIAATPIAWHAADGLPVTTVFLVAGPEPLPDNAPEKSRLAAHYLRIIARLMLLIKNSHLRNAMAGAPHADRVFELIREFDETGAPPGRA